MRDTAILLPVFALAGWTSLVLLLVGLRRLTAGVAPREYALGESDKVPVAVSLANRNYMNLLELPLLFYVACILAYVAAASAPSSAMLALAWSYVGLRVLHSLIHLTTNRVLHRFAAFALSNFVLLALWLMVGRAVLGGQAPA